MQRPSNFSTIRRKHFASHATTTVASVAGDNNNNSSSSSSSKNNDSTELQLVKNISDRLETGLNEDALRAISDLLRQGEHPDAIVAAVTSLSQRAAGASGSGGY
ncbi:mitotic-spindle organizing gamma-tubulin ring associated protein [Nitzschia inconspicua]|uniref:Mitotic-spindle organizing gamma-tubulin ring associated protein n=1 Tax=Nitzschia inconspicua TaxID=303405 RepID=A0A9K3Q0R3_9STRA|nr:mitotic-spindle organizing gamma-tubulin ring associated protein [Nitzschia inconspicua]